MYSAFCKIHMRSLVKMLYKAKHAPSGFVFRKGGIVTYQLFVSYSYTNVSDSSSNSLQQWGSTRDESIEVSEDNSIGRNAGLFGLLL